MSDCCTAGVTILHGSDLLAASNALQFVDEEGDLPSGATEDDNSEDSEGDASDAVGEPSALDGGARDCAACSRDPGEAETMETHSVGVLPSDTEAQRRRKRKVRFASSLCVEEAVGGICGDAVAPGADPEKWVVDVRAASDAAVILVFVCVLVQPLVYAHVNGFTVMGAELPRRAARPAAMAAIQRACNAVVRGASALAFMVGEYVGGSRLFAAPLDVAPEERLVCHTPVDRVRRRGAGCAFVWCTLAALAGTPAADVAARALLGTEAFVKPLDELADAARLTGTDAAIEFITGRTPAVSVVKRPLLENEASPPAWRALAQMQKSDSELWQLVSSSASDYLLAGWDGVIRPAPIADIPSHLLAHLPDFSGYTQLDK